MLLEHAELVHEVQTPEGQGEEHGYSGADPSELKVPLDWYGYFVEAVGYAANDEVEDVH